MAELGGKQLSTLLESLPGIASVLRSPVADAIANMIRAGAGIGEFQEQDVRELLQYATRRGLMGNEEADRLIDDVKHAWSKAKRPRGAKAGAGAAKKPAATKKPAVAKKTASGPAQAAKPKKEAPKAPAAKKKAAPAKVAAKKKVAKKATKAPAKKSGVKKSAAKKVAKKKAKSASKTRRR